MAWICDMCRYRVNGNGPDPPEFHRCDERSVVERQMACLDESFAAFLESPSGRFEVLYAQRRRAAAEQGRPQVGDR